MVVRPTGGLLPRELMPSIPREFQRAMVELGADLGSYGVQKDGVDGVFGTRSRDALEELTGTKFMNFDSSYSLAEQLTDLA